jgi:hypothetical protein
MDYSILNLMNGVPYERLNSSGFDADEFVQPDMLQPRRNAARIAEIQKRLAEIAEEKKNYSLEDEMGKYRFLFEGDPSTLMGHRQNMRNAEQTEKIRKATEDATKASNAQTAWKQLLIDEEAERYNLAANQSKAKQALESGNKSEYIAAKNDEARASAKLSRIAKDKELYKNKFAKMLGIEDRAEDELVAGYDGAADKDLAKLGDLENLVAGIDSGTDAIRNRPAKMSKAEKQKLIGDAKKNLADFRKRSSDLKLTLSPGRHADLEKSINEYEDTIHKFNKSQTVKLTKDSFEKMSGPQLVRMGKRALLKYKNQGWTNPNLDKAIAAAK